MRLFIRRSQLIESGEDLPTRGKFTVEEKKDGRLQIVTERQIVIEESVENTAIDTLDIHTIVFE